MKKKYLPFMIMATALVLSAVACNSSDPATFDRRVSLDDGWRFFKYENAQDADNLIYDVRPEVRNFRDDKDADSKPEAAVKVETSQMALKPYILPTANEFISDPAKHYQRPEGNPGADFPFVQATFDDSAWEAVDLPHDWAIKGPFQSGMRAEVGGGMGRLPSNGVGWYRKKVEIPSSDKGRSIFLDIDGAMSYAMVWCNGTLVGGWPYGYNSWRLDLTPYITYGAENQLAIRVDNPNNSARWYPGGGLYRNVWLTKTNAVHIAHWGTFIHSSEVSDKSAQLTIDYKVDNNSTEAQTTQIATDIFEMDENGAIAASSVLSFPSVETQIPAKGTAQATGNVVMANPRLWGPVPTQKPNLYMAVTTVYVDGKPVDRYQTRFGVRSLAFDGNEGVFVNGEHIEIQGADQHHDLGALGAAFNYRAAQRQLEILQEAGCNAIRMAHNPPAPELLELTDRMGFLVMDEVFDCWERSKTPHDFHLIFQDWKEADLRSFVRRDRNCPSIIMWSFGNEVGEQYTDQAGADLGKSLSDMLKEEDPTRPSTASMNYAKPGMPFPESMDVISLNYQGEGIRNAPAYAHLSGISTPPLYPAFHEAYPDKVIVSSETAAAVSSRGTYSFPVPSEISAPFSQPRPNRPSSDVRPSNNGGQRAERPAMPMQERILGPENKYVSAYEIFTAPFGSSADKVFASQDKHPYVAGEFVWSGWDYLGEPTPFYTSRSSYFGFIDLAGFKKDRFYLYQSRWRPDYPMVHILPHWNWPDRIGEVTPVHVFTSGDEAELFLNGVSQGKKTKGEYEYRLRWDNIVYAPGELKVVAYKDGKEWAQETVVTTDVPYGIGMQADRSTIVGDGKDLSFITVRVKDKDGLTVPTANNLLSFSIEGPGEIVATDNGDPSCMVAFPSKEREAFSGLALVIVRAQKGSKGDVTLTAQGDGLEAESIVIHIN